MIEMLDPTTTLMTLFLNIGLQNGILLRTVVDNVNGVLSDTRLRFLGSRPVKLFPLCINGAQSVLAFSSRPWLSFSHQSRIKLLPMS